MQTLQFGNIPWNRQGLIGSLKAFSDVYAKRSNKNNIGGMKSPHMFPTWFLTKFINPKVIIESGVFKGCGTWLFDQAAPNAKKICIEPLTNIIQYKSDMAEYTTIDFTINDWSDLDKSETLLFFDDHQNEIERIKIAYNLGFKHIVCEDNYPVNHGPCEGQIPYSRVDSPKKALMLNDENGKWIINNCEIYYEFPPIFKSDKTRWGTLWNDENYPTQKPLCETETDDYLKVFNDEKLDYTWICYLKLRY